MSSSRPTWKSLWLLLAGLGLLGLLSGCKSTWQKEKVTGDLDPLTRRALDAARQDAEKGGKGSLWNPRAPLNDLYSSIKAKNVGDVVLVRVVEDAKASNQTGSNSSKKTSLSAQVSSFMGMENRYPTPKSTFNPFGSIAGGMESDFEGKGGTSRTGQMKAELTATVVEVYANGNMLIYGTRDVVVNEERQMMALSGVIRPRDITAYNTVLSTAISDARIVFTGAGFVEDGQRPGWGTRIMEAVWPF